MLKMDTTFHFLLILASTLALRPPGGRYSTRCSCHLPPAAGVPGLGAAEKGKTYSLAILDNIIPADEIVPNQISSSRVRDCVRRGLSIKYLTSDEVIDYIREHKLFAEVEGSDTPSVSKYMHLWVSARELRGRKRDGHKKTLKSEGEERDRDRHMKRCIEK
ncbi:hypothetical protein EJB05_45276, partial [Eragrostis curvula]